MHIQLLNVAYESMTQLLASPISDLKWVFWTLLMGAFTDIYKASKDRKQHQDVPQKPNLLN